MICNKYTLDEICKSISDGDHQPPPKSDSGIPFVQFQTFRRQMVFIFMIQCMFQENIMIV